MILSVTTNGDGLVAQQQAALAALQGDDVPARLLAHDPTLWGPDAESEARRRLGWLDAVDTSWKSVPDLLRLRDELRGEGVTRVVLCGMGGSSLAPEVICRNADVDLVVLDSTHPDQVRSALSGDLRSTVVVVSSKSGSTVETDSQRRSFLAAFAEAGIDGPSRVVVVTDPGSPLEELARAEGYRAVFLADPNVGGRYSALTLFGLVPSALAGADVELLLDQATSFATRLSEDDNAGLRLGAALGADRRDKVVIDAQASHLPGFGDWAEQLVAESTGKDGKGLLPVVVEPDAPEVQWPAEDVHVVRIGSEVPPIGTAVQGNLGQQFFAWEYAVAVSGRLLGINPFDQPDVESAKQAARGLLESTPEPEEPTFTDGAVQVFASEGLLTGQVTLQGAVARLLSLVPVRGYLAVMAYLDRHRDSKLATCRVPLAKRVERPVTFGWGPRFLHSTGQYHKGGPPNGVFLQVTGLVAKDLQVPGRDFSYGGLIAAQAAGDAAVLAEHGRPVLRVHLLSTKGLSELLQVLS